MTDVALLDDVLVLNGVDAETGAYLTPELTVAALAGSLRDDPEVPSGASRCTCRVKGL